MDILALPSPQKTYDTIYDSFKGVDFSDTSLTVDRDRSPNSENMIGDEAGMPEKRSGFKRICALTGRINGIHSCNVGEERHTLVHSGTQIYRVFLDQSQEPILLISNINDEKSSSFAVVRGDRSYTVIMTGAEWLAYDGVTIVDVDEIVTIPLVIERADKNNYITATYPKNALTRRVKEGYFTLGGSVTFFVGGKVDTTKPYHVEASNYSAADQSSSIDIVPPQNYSYNSANNTLTVNYNVSLTPAGFDCNIFFVYYDAEEEESLLRRCDLATFYGPDGEDRLFVSGNPDLPACDWSSIKGDPLFFNIEDQTVFGDQNYRIMGYQKIGADLLIIKEDTGDDVSLYKRSYSTVGGETVFSISAGMSGAGAVSSDCFATLQDEPMFLSRTGVLAVTTDTINSERTLQNRSYLIDGRLLAEENLAQATAVSYKSFYMIGVGDHIYILDNRHRTDASFENSQFVYDGYFWSGISARKFSVELGDLLVGTSDGKVLKMIDDEDDPLRWMDDTEPIIAFWETRCDDDDLPNRLKTMQKKGAMIVLKNFSRTSAIISVAVDGGEFEVVDEVFFSRMDFEDFDFDSISFSASIDPQRFFFNKKIKRYNTMQFRVENSLPNESFGIYQLVKSFTDEGFAK